MKTTKKLKEYRNAAGLTQASLASKSTISIRTIQRIEKGLASGSPYTLKKLAEVLKIEEWRSLLEDSLKNEQTANLNPIKLMNLSSLAVLILPLGNFVFPLILFLKEKDRISHLGNKILSFQLLWLFATILGMLFVPIILIWIFDMPQGTKIPLFIPVYFLAVAINIYFIVKTAIRLNEKKEILTFVPKIF